MKISYTREEGKYVIKIYLPDTRKKTEEIIIGKIPSVMDSIREQKKCDSSVKNFLKRNGISL